MALNINEMMEGFEVTPSTEDTLIDEQEFLKEGRSILPPRTGLLLDGVEEGDELELDLEGDELLLDEEEELLLDEDSPLRGEEDLLTEETSLRGDPLDKELIEVSGKPVKQKFKSIPTINPDEVDPDDIPEITRVNPEITPEDLEPDDMDIIVQNTYTVGPNRVEAMLDGMKFPNVESFLDHNKEFIYKDTNLADIVESVTGDKDLTKHLYGSIASLDFYVNGETTEAEIYPVEGLTPEQAKKRVLLAASHNLDEIVNSLPDGMIIRSMVESLDEKGDSRTKFYKRKGMGELTQGMYEGYVAGVKLGGKIYPIDSKGGLVLDGI